MKKENKKINENAKEDIRKESLGGLWRRFNGNGDDSLYDEFMKAVEKDDFSIVEDLCDEYFIYSDKQLAQLELDFNREVKNYKKENGISEAKELISSHKAKKGKMHELLGLKPEDKVKDHYKSGRALYNALMKATDNDEKKVVGMLAYPANLNSEKDVFDDALAIAKKKNAVNESRMEHLVTKRLMNPNTMKTVSEVLVKGKGKFFWNPVYNVYNSATNYDQLTKEDEKNFEWSKPSTETTMKENKKQDLTKNSDKELSLQFNNTESLYKELQIAIRIGNFRYIKELCDNKFIYTPEQLEYFENTFNDEVKEYGKLKEKNNYIGSNMITDFKTFQKNKSKIMESLKYLNISLSNDNVTNESNEVLTKVDEDKLEAFCHTHDIYVTHSPEHNEYYFTKNFKKFCVYDEQSSELIFLFTHKDNKVKCETTSEIESAINNYLKTSDFENKSTEVMKNKWKTHKKTNLDK